jgi:RNA polymerase sigma-70 factor (ECF subfamily)
MLQRNSRTATAEAASVPAGGGVVSAGYWTAVTKPQLLHADSTAALPSLAQGQGRDALPPPDAHEGVVERMRARDAAALAELYDQTVARVFALARLILQENQEAEDLVAEVYERAWFRVDQFDPARGTALVWLLGICRNEALDRLRRRRRALRAHEILAQQPEIEEAEQPQDVLSHFQRGHAVHAAMAALTPLRRRIVALAYFRGLSHQELAAELGMPLGTVKSHLRRALAELRDRLGKEGGLG